jgi:hypothetical protein
MIAMTTSSSMSVNPRDRRGGRAGDLENMNDLANRIREPADILHGDVTTQAGRGTPSERDRLTAARLMGDSETPMRRNR